MANKREKEIEECFLLYDYPQRHKIPNSKLRELMNALGQNATDNELDQLIKKADPKGEGAFTLDGFKRVMSDFSSVQYTKNDLRSAYELLDRDMDGFLSKQDLKNASKLLLGFPLDDDKIEFMFKNLKSEDNKISFEQFVKLLE